ncbi:amino acid adenylation domain-containing protein [Corynebacterium sp. TAE3-ERU12]|uniref:non-ribosomal peptide synthetase n=1 Tax=Corynebacterium sp. TAE3-ERU12 TaxID=2849491 RepID=UPI001C43A9B3|nr:non-ribosomal peptide synthetase [Corynebacterium sp. TAE3-ERU12]MBV7294666.1 amino acid adenylation domain-containing protein [Corynebacterium sp. TAE3-ERU12]
MAGQVLDPAVLVVAVDPETRKIRGELESWQDRMRSEITRWRISTDEMKHANHSEVSSDGVLIFVADTPAQVWEKARTVLPAMPGEPGTEVLKQVRGSTRRDVLPLPLSESVTAYELRRRLDWVRGAGETGLSVVDARWGLGFGDDAILHCSFGPVSGTPAVIRRDSRGQWVLEYSRSYLTRRQALQWACVLTEEGADKPPVVDFRERIQARIAQGGDGLVVVDEAESCSASELDQAVGDLVARLRIAGVHPGVPVLVHLPRGVPLVIAVLALFRLGAVYVPVDPVLPKHRIRRIAQISGARHILGDPIPNLQDAMAVAVRNPDASTVPDDDWYQWRPDDCLFILFTSGSTGEPKGVAMRYGCIEGLVGWHCGQPGVVPQPNVAQFAASGFDVAYQEIMCTLAEGGVIHVVPEDIRRDPGRFCDWITQNEIDTVYSPAVVLRELAATAVAEGRPLRSLRRLIHAGEPLILNESLISLLEANPGIVLRNQYGPTETHVVTDMIVDSSNRLVPGAVPLGDFLGEDWGYLLDEQLRPVPPGVVGEIYLRGGHAAAGYWRDAARTATAFVADPEVPGGRMYRTGDLARRRADGVLEIVGRDDDQVKIRGHRVELGEVSAVVDEIPGVRQVVTAVRRTGDGAGSLGLRTLVEAPATVTEERVREYLAERLPDYAVPREIVIMERIPRTATGKLDRRAQPQPRSDTAEPIGTKHSAVRQAWAEALGCDPEDSRGFLELGGDSLTAMRLVLRLRMLTGKEISISEVLSLGGVDAVEEHLSVGTDDCGEVLEILPAVGSPDAPYPLLDQQQAYLIGRDDALDGGSVACHLYLEYAGPRSSVDVTTLIQALRMVMSRHPIFGIRIDPDRGLQEPDPDLAGFEVQILDSPCAEQAATQVRGKLATKVRDPRHAPLLDVVVVRDESELRVCIDVDALIADARSIHTLVLEWNEAYASGDVAAPPPAIGFKDYVESHRRWCMGAGERTRRRDLDYWTRVVAELPPPPALPRTSGVSRTAGFRHRRYEVPADLWRQITKYGRAHKLTPSTILLTAYACALANWSGQRRFTLNVPRFGRAGSHPDLDRVIGEFASFTLLDTDVRDPGTFVAAARTLQRRLHEDLAHGSVSGMEVLRELFRQRGSSGEPVAPCVFTSELGIGADLADLAGGALRQIWAISQTPQVDLDLQVADHRGSVALRLDILDARLPDAVVEGLWGTLLDIIHGLGDPSGWLLSPPPATTCLALMERADGGAPVAPRKPLTGWIAERADSRDIWCIVEEREITYRDLAERVAAGVKYLAEEGPDAAAPVAVAVSDRAEAITVILAVVHSGRVVVPIDPDVPRTRLVQLIRRCGADLLIGDFPKGSDLPVSCIRPRDFFCEEGAESLRLGMPQTPQGPCATILFTGGTTGEPKGVRVPREGLEICIAETIRMCGITATDRSLFISPPHHDMASLDVYLMGLVGGTVLSPPTSDGQGWAEAVVRNGATVVCGVPAAVELLLEGARLSGASLTSLRIVLTGGDWVPPELVRRLREHSPGVRIWSIGGPTETTAWNIAYEVPGEAFPEGWGSVPYGQPLPGTRYRIVDERGDDRPTGVEGELVVDGPGVMLGYLDEDLPDIQSAERTVLRRYATGDRGTWRVPGLIEFLGRADRQVEIRGYRVEPAEIEAALLTVPGVRSAAVVPLVEELRVRALAAAYVGGPDMARIRAAAEEMLPAHAVPRRFLQLAELPRTPSGKIDRTEIGRLLARATDAGKIIMPPDPLTGLIVDIWAEAAGLEDATPDSSFLQAGGDSLGALRVVAVLREIFAPDQPIGIRVLLSGATPADCAVLLRETADAEEFEALAADYAADGNTDPVSVG